MRKRLSWDSSPSPSIHHCHLSKYFQRGSPGVTTLYLGDLHLTDHPMLTRNCLLLFLWILSEEVSCLRLPQTTLSGRGRAWRERTKTPVKNGAAVAAIPRVKRGWVWNQFFVLEEYMGSDPQYVGKVNSLVF